MRAIRCGAKGYVMKSRPADELLAAASRVSAGKVHMSEALAEEVALNTWEGKPTSLHESLSDREYLVFAMLVCGKSVTSIAATLHLSIKTISTHKARAMVKLRCKSLSDMIQYCIGHNLSAECRARCADR
jgi:DNA-binding NarL/FixJ family response regulator